MWPVCSLKSTVRQRLPSALGRTHASSVIALVRSRSSASAIRTESLTPSNDSAPAFFPAADHVGPLSVPVWPLPVTSWSVVPLPALKSYAATGLPGWGAVNVAVSVWSVLGTVTVCVLAPPSDHDANVLPDCGDGASTVERKPTSSLTVNGAMLGTPSTVMVRPAGAVANVRLAFCGRIVTDRDAWIPSLSVA